MTPTTPPAPRPFRAMEAALNFAATHFDTDDTYWNERAIAAENDLEAARDAVEALHWALTYGTFDVATDNPLHKTALHNARAVLSRCTPAGKERG